jgi:hydroxymethylpyrimidine/phosphomethylpyrimidine kinase
VKVALTIAGSDSGGGAGIQADLKTFAAHGVHGTSAITAVTAQNSVTVARSLPLPTEIVVAQIEAVASDMPVAALKTGMLATRDIVLAVAETVARLRLPRLVVDPVMVAKSGDRLLDPAAVRAYVEVLFPLADIITPNLFEAEALMGRPLHSLEDMREAARWLKELGPRAVVVKGGHLEGDAVDAFFDGARMEDLPSPRIATRNTHGTGCTYSAAMAARLALGDGPLEAVRGAKEYVTEAIRRSYSVGKGHGPLDQMHLLAQR